MADLQEVYERIKKRADSVELGKYDMYYDEIKAIRNLSPDWYHMISTAFNFGFDKGCRKTRKELSV